jgi:hypothetical protein
MVVGHIQTSWAMAVARRLPAVVGILQPPWAMTVRPQTAVGRMIVKNNFAK